jgi:hypothetical protein
MDHPGLAPVRMEQQSVGFVQPPQRLLDGRLVGARRPGELGDAGRVAAPGDHPRQ